MLFSHSILSVSLFASTQQRETQTIRNSTFIKVGYIKKVPNSCSVGESITYEADTHTLLRTFLNTLRAVQANVRQPLTLLRVTVKNVSVPIKSV